MVASCVPPTGDLARIPGMCPDWQSNRRPFGSLAGTQSTELHQPEQHLFFFYPHPRTFFFTAFRERERGRERETLIRERNTDQLLLVGSLTKDLTCNLVCALTRLEPATFQCAGQPSNQLNHTGWQTSASCKEILKGKLGVSRRDLYLRCQG